MLLFLLLCFTLCPFVTKRGSNFYFLDQDCIFNRSSDFCPRNGQRGSLLVCNWPHSVGQNHFFVKMLFIKDSAIQKCSRRFCTIYKSENSISCQPSGRPAVQCINRPNDVTYRLDAH